MSDSILTAALKLADRGIRVFPCKQDKTPYTEHGFKDATSGEDIIADWWVQWPDALVGVPTGIWFDVLDLDLQHEPARQWLNQHRDRLPVTRTHMTRSDGHHLLFRPSGVKCSAGLIAPNVDTRGTGGYIIWWPAHGFAAENPGTIAPLPLWLVAALNPPPKPTLVSSTSSPLLPHSDGWLRGLVRLVAWAPEGQRNSILFWASCRGAEAVRAGKAAENFVVDVLVEAAAHAGLPAREAKRTVDSGMKRP
jgi:hypothetical protein